MSAAIKAQVHIIPERCRGCAICIEVCQCGVLEKPGLEAEGQTPVPFVRDAAACTGCGICQMLCPDFAIWVSFPENEEEGEGEGEGEGG